MREIVNEKAISIPEVKEILERIISAEKIDVQPAPAPVKTGEDGAEVVPETVEADKTKKYFLKSTYEYAKTFSKIDARVAKNVVLKLVSENQLPLLVAIQIVNVNPDTTEELALLLEKGQKRYSSDEVEKLMFAIRAYRELP
jgi:DNA-directed RNA polymerase subunit F